MDFFSEFKLITAITSPIWLGVFVGLIVGAAGTAAAGWTSGIAVFLITLVLVGAVVRNFTIE